MKRISLIFALPMVLLFSNLGQAADTPLMILSYEEWSALPTEAQLQYLGGLQKIIGGMDQRSEYFAEVFKAPTRTPASTGATGGGTALQKLVTVVKETSDKTFIKKEQKFANSEAVAEHTQMRVQEAMDQIDAARKEPNSDKKLEHMKKASDLLEKARVGMMIAPGQDTQKVYDKWAMAHKQLELNGRGSKSILAGQVSPLEGNLERIKKLDLDYDALAIASKNKLDKKDGAQERISEALKAVLANPNYAAARTEYGKAADELLGPKKEFFRCMYAGFVLKENCKAPSKLPGDINLVGINKSNFNCEGNQVLCNPLLFGGKLSCPLVDSKKETDPAKKKEAVVANETCLAQLKPDCQPRGRNATSDCLASANKFKNHNLQVTAALIHANPKEWDEYAVSFHGLCDENKIDRNAFAKKKGEAARKDQVRVEKDISLTCGWARKRLMALRDEAGVHLSFADTAKVKAESPTDKNEKKGKK